MASCPVCGATVKASHSFCPECAEPISSAAKATARSSSRAKADPYDEIGTSDEDGLSRRTLLMAGGGVVVAAVVGGAGRFLLMSGGPGDPEARARAFVQALDDGDTDRYNSMLHSDSDMQQLNASNAERLQSMNISVASTELMEQNATNARIRTEVAMEFLGQRGQSNVTVILAAEAGEWKVLEGGTPVAGSAS